MCEMGNTCKENHKQVQTNYTLFIITGILFRGLSVGYSHFSVGFRLNIFLHCEYSYIIKYGISVWNVFGVWMLLKKLSINVLALYLISIQTYIVCGQISIQVVVFNAK